MNSKRESSENLGKNTGSGNQGNFFKTPFVTMGQPSSGSSGLPQMAQMPYGIYGGMQSMPMVGTTSKSYSYPMQGMPMVTPMPGMQLNRMQNLMPAQGHIQMPSSISSSMPMQSTMQMHDLMPMQGVMPVQGAMPMQGSMPMTMPSSMTGEMLGPMSMQSSFGSIPFQSGMPPSMMPIQSRSHSSSKTPVIQYSSCPHRRSCPRCASRSAVSSSYSPTYSFPSSDLYYNSSVPQGQNGI